MPDKDKEKIGESTWDNPDESTSEMEIIKDVFGGAEAAPGAGDQVFSTDLFSEPAAAPTPPPAPEPKAPPAAPAKSAPGKSGLGKSAPGKSSPGKPAPPKEAAKEPLPPPPPPAPEKKALAGNKAEPIKVVTDDDLRTLFDQSSPGIGPGDLGAAPEPAAPKPARAAAKAPPAPEPAESRKGKTPAPPAAAASGEAAVLPGAEIFSVEVEEMDIDSRPGISTPSARASSAPGAPPSPPPADTAEDVVEQIETRAKVGEMTVSPAAKKGDALQQTEQALSGLSPIGDDFMSVDELKKLFNNVSILTDWAQEAAERIGKIEARLDQLLKSKGNK